MRIKCAIDHLTVGTLKSAGHRWRAAAIESWLLALVFVLSPR